MQVMARLASPPDVNRRVRFPHVFSGTWSDSLRKLRTGGLTDGGSRGIGRVPRFSAYLARSCADCPDEKREQNRASGGKLMDRSEARSVPALSLVERAANPPVNSRLLPGGVERRPP